MSHQTLWFAVGNHHWRSLHMCVAPKHFVKEGQELCKTPRVSHSFKIKCLDSAPSPHPLQKAFQKCYKGFIFMEWREGQGDRTQRWTWHTTKPHTHALLEQELEAYILSRKIWEQVGQAERKAHPSLCSLCPWQTGPYFQPVLLFSEQWQILLNYPSPSDALPVPSKAQLPTPGPSSKPQSL